MKIVDSHQHFWMLRNNFSDWPTPDLNPIFCDFLPKDLTPILQANGVTKTILIQAAPNEQETDFLLSIASTCDFVGAVVGWIDFAAPDAEARLARLAADPKLRGLRPMVQDIPEQGWLLRRSFDAVYDGMVSAGLTFDALVRRSQMREVATLADRHPGLSIVLDHAGKPDIRNGDFSLWARDVEHLSLHANVSCKLSGLWTEAGSDHAKQVISPYVKHLIECFGSSRLMWGSDWPVINLSGSYADWLNQCQEILASICNVDHAAIFGGNAGRFYGIN